MDEQQIKDLIDRKVVEAKLVVAEKRLQFLLWFGGAIIAVFGIFVPFWQIRDSTEKVDKAIQGMEKRVSELVGRQLRKPDVECLVDARSLENSKLEFTFHTREGYIEPDFKLWLKNIGDASTDQMKLTIYIDTEHNINEFFLSLTSPNNYDVAFNPISSDEGSYSKAFQAELNYVLQPEEPRRLYLILSIEEVKEKEWLAPALMKIYYGEEPKIIPFQIALKIQK